MPAATVAPNHEMYQDLLCLMSEIVRRNESDGGNLYDSKEFLTPKAFAKYFASDEYAGEPFGLQKETELNQYTWLLRRLDNLDKFIEKHEGAVMQEWDKIQDSYFTVRPNSDNQC